MATEDAAMVIAIIAALLAIGALMFTFLAPGDTTDLSFIEAKANQNSENIRSNTNSIVALSTETTNWMNKINR